MCTIRGRGTVTASGSGTDLRLSVPLVGLQTKVCATSVAGHKSTPVPKFLCWPWSGIRIPNCRRLVRSDQDTVLHLFYMRYRARTFHRFNFEAGQAQIELNEWFFLHRLRV